MVKSCMGSYARQTPGSNRSLGPLLRKILLHGLEVVVLPAAFLIAGLAVRDFRVMQCQPRAGFGEGERHGDDRIGIGWGKLVRSPRLYDPSSLDELDVLAGDVTVPSGNLGADLLRHFRFAAGHRRVAPAVEPSLIDRLRRGGKRTRELEIVGHSVSRPMGQINLARAKTALTRRGP